jgi:deoxyribodipyrimidine photo-lyase
MIGIFIFTRDLRIEDNTTLNKARLLCDVVMPIFVFTPEQTEHNSYFSGHCFSFMIDCLENLNKKLQKHNSRLFYFHGTHKNIVEKLINKLKINYVFINEDITPYSKQRSKQIHKVCTNHDVKFIECSDLFLLETQFDKKYAMFTPYYDKVMSNNIKKCKLVKKNNFYNKKNNIVGETKIMKKQIENVHTGGRTEAIKKLNKINTNYDSNTKDKTSLLSPYLKFGCLSSREVYWFIRKKFGKKLNETFLRQLIWRDFYYQLYLNNNELFYTKNPNYKWNNNSDWFNKWCNGKTGFPIVDSAMRELNKTGCMHNRLRLVVSCFLVKTLYIDWRKGEKYLLDYDPILNNANWQWITGTLPGSKQPWFRIISPWIQSKKFDHDAEYIKEWIKELSNVQVKEIHKWYDYFNEKIYYKPIVDFEKQKKKYL